MLLPERAGLSIWHNGDNGGNDELYGLIQSGVEYFEVDATSGTVRVGNDFGGAQLPEGTYNITVYRSASSPRPVTVMLELQLVVDESAPRSNLPGLMIEASDDPVVVAADASMGVMVVTVSASGGTNPMFDAANNDDLTVSEGDAATIILARDAALAFTLNNLTLSLTLTAETDDAIETATATIRFVSAPLAINNPNPFVKELAYSEAVANDGDIGERRIGAFPLASRQCRLLIHVGWRGQRRFRCGHGGQNCDRGQSFGGG